MEKLCIFGRRAAPAASAGGASMEANGPSAARVVCAHQGYIPYSITRRGFRAPQARVRAPKALARRPFPNMQKKKFLFVFFFASCSRRCALPLRVIEHTRALRRSARHARAFGARSRRCAPAAGAARLPNMQKITILTHFGA